MDSNFRPSFILSPISTTPKLKNRLFFPLAKSPTSTPYFNLILLIYIFSLGEKITATNTFPPSKIPKIKTTFDLFPSKQLDTPKNIENRPLIPPHKISVPTILAKVSKESRSISPHLRNLEQEEVHSAMLVRKYKQQRSVEQERDIQLHRLAKQLEEELEGNACLPQNNVATLLLEIVELILR